MSKFKLSLIVVMLAAFSMPALAGDKAVKRVPAGAVAFHFVADVSFTTGNLVGYLAFIEGVDSSLFWGAPSEATAHFTICLTAPTPAPTFLVIDPGLGLTVSLLEPAGAQFTVFYNSERVDRSWDMPETFCEGEPIAVFEESALLGTLVSGTGFNAFSSSLVDSTPIKFNGQKINFKRIVPNGVTTTNFAVQRPDMSGARFGGTSIAIGGKFRDDSDD